MPVSIKMELAYDSGNLFIKHNDKWRGDYYLKEDFEFTTDKNLAARFYLLKSGDTTILNGDRISINCGSRVLVIDESNQIKLVDRELCHHGINSFIIGNGTDNTDPINFDSGVFFITDKDEKIALRYIWGMDLIDPSDTDTDASNYKPRNHPNLTHENYGNVCEANIGSFQFQLERATVPVTAIEDNRTIAVPPIKQSSRSWDLFDRYKGAVMLFLLMIILILCIVIGGDSF